MKLCHFAAPALVAVTLFAAQCGHAQTVSLNAVNNATIQPGGPRSGNNGKAFFNAEGSANGTFADFGVVDFGVPAGTAPIAPSSLTLNLTEANAGFTHAGSVNFYLTQDTTIGIDPGASPLAYNAAALPDGLGTQLAPNFFLGSGAFTTTGNVNNGKLDSYTFGLTAPESAYIASRIGSNSFIRLIVAPGDASVSATWAGFTFNSAASRPKLSLTAVPEPGSCTLLAALAFVGALRLRSRRH